MNRTFRSSSLFLLAGTLIAACTDSSGPGFEDAIASITISGAPTAPLRAGSTVQLAVTPINSTGAIVSNARVQWSSSDASIAAVSDGGLVTGVEAGHVTITAEAGGAEATVALSVLIAKEIGRDGGAVESATGAARLIVPQGTLNQSTEVTLAAALVDPIPANMVAKTGWTVGFAGGFGGNAPTLSIRYESAGVPAGMPEGSLQLYHFSDQYRGWNAVPGSTVDVATRTVSGYVGRSGTFAVMSSPVSRTVLAGAVVNGAIYMGQETQLTAAGFTAAGDTARGYGVTWTSSNNAVASVTDAGNVTGAGAGTATITATIGDKSASTSISVIARPESSWFHTRDWTTYQGNNRRTGAIAAVVDPSTFAARWSKSLDASTTPPVTGGGHVYVTAGSGLRAFNATGGAEVWRYDLGSRESYDPPAFGGGHVYVATGGHGNSFLFGVDAITGTLKFRSTYRNQWSSWYAPAVENGHVYKAGGYYGGMYSFDGVSGDERWFVSTAQYDEWTPAVHEGRVYAYTDRLQVVDAATGTELFSIQDADFVWGGWSTTGAPALGSRDNVLTTQGGRLISFDLPGQRIGWQISGGFSGPVTVQNDAIFVIKAGGVEARNEVDGSLLWSWVPPEGSVRGGLIATHNVVFASTENRTYAIDSSARRHTWSYPSGGHLAVTADGLLLIVEPAGKITAISIR